MSKTIKKPAKKAAPKAAKKAAAKPTSKKEFEIGDVVTYVITESEAESQNKAFGETLPMVIEKIRDNGEHLLKGEARPGDLWTTGAFYSKDNDPGTFH